MINKIQTSNPYLIDSLKKDKEPIQNKKEEKVEEVNYVTKMDRIKKEIEEGTYKINLNSTVESIANELM